MTNTLLQQVIRRMERRQVVVSPAFTTPAPQRRVKKSTGTDPAFPQDIITQVPDMIQEINRNKAQDTDFKELGTKLVRRYGVPDYNPNGTFVLNKIWNRLKQIPIAGLPDQVVGQKAHGWFLRHGETAERLL